MENTDAHWKKWGEFDPYRAVQFYEKYKRGNNLQELFATGEDYIEFLMRKLAVLYPALGRETAVDFGCGVGRLTVPLAQRFERVIGVDISPAMIAESRRNCSLRGVTNAEFVGTDDLVPSGVQLVHSYLVLQHIPVKRGLVVVKRLIDRLAPGGVCALHVPMQREKRRIAYLIKHYVPISRYALNVLQGKDIREPLMQMNSYPARRMFDSLNDAGVRDIWVIPLIPFPGLNGLSVIWLGRKGG